MEAYGRVGKKKGSKQVEALLDGDAAAGVGQVAVAVYQAADNLHGARGGILEGQAVLEVPDEEGAEDVARAVEGGGDFSVGKAEIMRNEG